MTPNEELDENTSDGTGEDAAVLVEDDDTADPIDDTEGEATTWRDGAIPPPPPPPSERQFVRDPYARLGGVASGVAHYFGWDVALTRLGFIALILASGGTAILLYLAAWIIVPRASHWPPTGGRAPSTRLTSREIGIGLAAAGVILALVIAGGRPGAVLIPLALIGGGIWLLTQSPNGGRSAVEPPAPTDGDRLPTADPEPVSAEPPEATLASLAPPAPPVSPPPLPPAPPYDPGAPVPPRSRSRRWVVRLLIAFAVLLVLLIIAIPTVLFFVARSGNLDIDPDRRVVVRPAAVVEIPDFVNEDEAEVILDLTDLSAEDFDDVDTPVEIEVDVDAGEIDVRLPDDLRVDIAADVVVGGIELFGSDTGGFFTDRNIDVDDPHIDLELDVAFGQITVARE